LHPPIFQPEAVQHGLDPAQNADAPQKKINSKQDEGTADVYYNAAPENLPKQPQKHSGPKQHQKKTILRLCTFEGTMFQVRIHFTIAVGDILIALYLCILQAW
jgi:hypothetical protein